MEKYRWFLVFIAGLQFQCAQVTHIAGEAARTYRIEARTQDLSADDEMHALISPYQERLREEMDQEVGIVAKQLVKGRIESTLGNWVADAIYDYAERTTEQDYAFGLCNSGGIRVQSVGKGPITKGKVFELMPFDNYLVVTKMTGQIVKELFDHMAKSGGWPISHGVTYEIEAEEARNIKIDDQPLDMTKQYSVVLSDYLSEGGGGCEFLEDLPYENLNVYYRDALIEQAQWLTRAGKEIDADIEGRVTEK